MQGSTGPEPDDRVAQAAPPDWPAPGTPLPGDEPTQELPVITAATAPPEAAWTGATLARAALSLALTGRPSTPTALSGTSGSDRSPDAPRPSPSGPSSDAQGPAPSDRSPDALAPSPSEWWPGAPSAAQPSPVPAGTDPWAAGPPGPAPSSADVPGAAAGPPGRRWLVAAGIAAVALVLTGATVLALSRHDPAPRPWGPPAAAAAAHTVTGALGGRTAAAFDLVDGARTITLRTADLGNTLYRVSTPAGSAVSPRADESDGRIRLRLDGDADAVDVALSTRVRWDLRVGGGADSSTIDLTGGRVGGVDLSGGASRIMLTLPRPDGTLTVRMSGGVSLFDVRTAGAAPVRVQVGRGAGSVMLGGRTHRGVAAGQTFTTRSWTDTADRVDVQAVAGLAALTVAPTGG
ncbi:hypothetical protein COUCH_24095 [Couchioplanes caeruleus]|uniref:hypothetical protein n=1 Tax=Couchioplanes caeruleus TaxID=56438 RepID=UPI0020C01645|nr:hypothetical protein [Couchioplanes caeruleus]UQU62117.1 hypothetical protein COUCH_24095 [Couchioplanes caeruleus]